MKKIKKIEPEVAMVEACEQVVCQPKIKREAVKPASIHDFELLVLAKVCMLNGLTMDYMDKLIMFNEDYYKTIHLDWKGYGDIEQLVFEQAWNKARKSMTYTDGSCDLEEYDANHWRCRDFMSDILSGRDYGSAGFAQVKFHYDKLVKKSPLGGLEWAEPFMRKAAPWCSLKEVANRIISSLNHTFMYNSVITSYKEKLVGELYFEYAIGHEDGYPLVWRKRYDWSDWDTITVLKEINVRLYADRLEVNVGKKKYVLETGQQLAKMLLEIPHQIQKIWLETDTSTLVVNSLGNLGLLRNENYDTQVYIMNDVKPGSYAGQKTMKPSNHNFLNLYNVAENATKKEEA